MANQSKVNASKSKKRLRIEATISGLPEKLTLVKAVNACSEGVSQTRQMIYTIYKDNLWDEKYASFDELVEKELQDICGRSNAYRHINAAKIDVILSFDIGTVPITTAELLHKKGRTGAQVRHIWKLAAEELDPQTLPRTKAVKEAIEAYENFESGVTWINAKHKPHSLLHSLSPKEKKKLCKSMKALTEQLQT
ncbi:hypothetical protein [Neptunomonas japonica]|uniref:Uncharacterized protein n=1 Tax=Neptunomonas japonica JAMM 1380 TaxID=1441457 RepID=A0A7R6PD08_9GAMM|nr:hypothetical protein [Neptunomonas japonica]BBB31474.1 hypothetical protein NEJAP_3536 [Neptunomonas japonica JAMM 1380]